jgi:hypothetical protein
MSRRIAVIIALTLVSVFLIGAIIVGHEALAAFLGPEPHTCGGG